jgi:hypothetical protein
MIDLIGDVRGWLFGAFLGGAALLYAWRARREAQREAQTQATVTRAIEAIKQAAESNATQAAQRGDDQRATADAQAESAQREPPSVDGAQASQARASTFLARLASRRGERNR